jgi:eukaryotic-like serine/threonine-protein kinase
MNDNRWQRIEKLYFKALEFPTGERARFLADETAGDEELYREVFSLLKSHEHSGDFLSEPEFALGLQILAEPNHVFRAGQEFGKYTIIKFLGSGGMGEVYQARDNKLERIVALKVLPADLASNNERIRRFMQEARSASALNHPNILTIHEIGESDGWHYIASEFVEGETLRQRMKSETPPDLPEILEISRQIATALNAAHKAGIVHRDIKPENIMLREDGLVKILDFGLAKLTESLHAQNTALNLQTTNPGLILGTVAYMSPEQARGQKTDARSDIWSFGVVLYEMLTGKTPFEGSSPGDIIAAILTAEPSIHNENFYESAPELRQMAAKALRKEPAERYQYASEIITELKKISVEPGLSAKNTDSFVESKVTDLARATASKKVSTSDFTFSRSTAISFDSGKSKALVSAAVLITVVLAGALAVYYFSSRNTRAPGAMKITRILDTGKTTQAAISPDGKYLAQVSSDAGQTSLSVRHIATNSSVQLVPPAAVGIASLTFSNDGDYIFYVSRQKDSPGILYQIPVLGGEPRKILENISGAATFSPDGKKFAFVRNVSPDETALITVNSDGGEERVLASRHKPDYLSASPSWSPDGAIIACATGTSKGDRASKILLFSAESGQESQLSDQKWRLVDRLQWLNDGSGLVAPAIEMTGQEAAQIWFFPFPGGEARRITNDLNDYAGISLTADSNSLVTLQFEMRRNFWLVSNTETGEAKSITDNIPDNYRAVAWTSDKKIIYPSLNAGNRDIWIMNSDGSNRKQITSTPHNDILPDASPDGKYIAFGSNRSPAGTVNIWRVSADGANPVQLTFGKDESFPKFTPDSKWIIYVSGANDSPPELRTIWKISVEGGEPIQLTTQPAFGSDVSPDGKQFACWYKIDKSAPWKIAVIPIEGGEPVKLLDAAPATQLRWSPDGKEIAYVKTENSVSNIWSQPINGDPPRQLTGFTSEQIFQYDWSDDNQIVCSRGTTIRSAILISNFR